jgi:uncharacterized protein (TIGR04255 family)
MGIEKLLRPYNEQHSIKEVVFTLYFTQLIEDFTSWEEFHKEMNVKGFEKIEKLNGIKYTINTADLSDIQSQNSGLIGIIWKKYQDSDSIKQSLQVRNLEAQDHGILSFHELSYVRWANFKKDYLDIIKNICLYKNIGSLAISALNLTYIDEFTWIGDEPIQLDKIFNQKSSYLSEYFFKNHFPSIDIAAMISEDDSKEFLTERLVIDIQHTQPFPTFVIAHTIASSLENVGSLSNFYESSIDAYLEKTHAYNKQTLFNLLVDDVRTLIQFPKSI